MLNKRKARTGGIGIKKVFFGKLTVKIVVIFMVTALVLTIGGYYYQYVISSENLENLVVNHLNTGVQSRADHIDTFLEEHIQTMDFFIISSGNLRALPMLETGSAEHNSTRDFVTRMLNNVIDLQPEVGKIYVIGPEGTVIASTNEEHKEIGKDENEVLKAVMGKGFFIGDLYWHGSFGVPALNLNTPIKDDSGNTIGVLVTSLDASKIYDILMEKSGLGETGEMYLINKDGYMISPSRFLNNTFMRVRVDTFNSRNCLESLAKSTETYSDSSAKTNRFLDYRNVMVIGTYDHIHLTEWCMLGEMDLAETLKEENEKITFFLYEMIIAMMIISLIIAIIISKILISPIQKLIYATREMNRGNFRVRVDIKSGDETEELGKSFNKMAEALDVLESEREELEKAKTRFLSITGHELRSPMTPMKAQLQMLLKGYFGKLTEKQRSSMETVLRNTERLDGIIKDFLEISRIEAARLKFKFIKVDIGNELRELAKEMDSVLPEKNIKVEAKMEEMPVIKVDMDRISQVIRNLAINAKKFSPKGSKITIGAKVVGKEVVVYVKDRGIGISKDHAKRIFEPFYQEEESMYRKYGGIGMGLAITKGIVEAQGGRIWVESVRGKGSTFYFTIPVKPVKEMKPIKIIFSEQGSIEGKLLEVFKEALGPMGENEFSNMRGRINKKEIFRYIDTLVKDGVLEEEKGNVFRERVAMIFGEITKKKKNTSAESRISKFFGGDE